MWSMARRVASRILSEGEKGHVLVVTHHDADGISSGAIATGALVREQISCSTMVVKSLEDNSIASIKERIRDTDSVLVWFTDLGSGSLSKLEGINAVFTDHHGIDPEFLRRYSSNLTDITSFSDADPMERLAEDIYMVNPHLMGKGDDYVSGSGATYLVAKSMSKANIEFSPIAVVGAVGDMMDSTENRRRLEDMNREILEEAVSAGLIEIVQDLRAYGYATKSVVEYVTRSDIAGPGISQDYTAARKLLSLLGIEDADKRHWYELSHREKTVIISALIENSITEDENKGVQDLAHNLGEIYLLTGEEESSPTREAKEFSTLLNSCGRHGKGLAGIQVCLGDREDYLREALNAIKTHRKEISSSINYAQERLVKREVIQYFMGDDEIGETIVGSVAGKLYATPYADSDKVIIGIAKTDDGTAYKISSRASGTLTRNNIDLHEVMSQCASAVGGVGGGHTGAAGATIPLDKLDEFLDLVEKKIKEQYGSA